MSETCLTGKFVICRSRDQGVVCGVLKSLVVGQGGATCGVEDARQIHGWNDGANTLFEMSQHGCGVARISEPVPFILIFSVCGVLPCTETAEKNLRTSRWNESAANSTSRHTKTPSQ